MATSYYYVSLSLFLFFFSVNFYDKWLRRSAGPPLAVGDGAATTLVRISLTSAVAVVVRTATLVAWNRVSPQGSVANESSCIKLTTADLRRHQHLIVVLHVAHAGEAAPVGIIKGGCRHQQWQEDEDGTELWTHYCLVFTLKNW